MANMFYFSYIGNKRTEMKFIMPYLKDLQFDKVVEPFCGSCAFSLHLAIKEKMNKQFIINDNDSQLIAFLRNVKEHGSKEFYDYMKDELKDNSKENFVKHMTEFKAKPDDLKLYFYYNLHYNFRKGLYSDRIKKFKTDMTKTDLFFKNCEINGVDYKIMLEKYKNDTKALLFLDPPYFDSFNSYYKDFQSTKGKGFSRPTKSKIIVDNTQYYIELLEYLKSCKCKVITILSSSAVIEYLYKDYIKEKYKKTYSITNKQTTHLIITNF